MRAWFGHAVSCAAINDMLRKSSSFANVCEVYEIDFHLMILPLGLGKGA